jgi:ketosteroid isomerase-like protein
MQSKLVSELPESAEKNVFMRRMQAIMDGDIDAMMSCYAEDAVLFMTNRVLHGYDEIRTLFAAGFGSGNYSGLAIELSQLVVEGEVVYAVWSAKSASFNTPFGTDTFIIRDGKIAIQTSAAQVVVEED